MDEETSNTGKRKTEKKDLKQKKYLKIPLFSILSGFFIALLLKFFVIDIMTVKGKSMIPALKDGSHVIINRLAYGLNIPFSSKTAFSWSSPKEGDVVIYMYDNRTVVKRCIATEGALLEYSAENGYTLSVNNLEIPLTQSQFHKLLGIDRIPQGYFLAVGDNYELSVDSREYGFIPVENALGRVLCR